MRNLYTRRVCAFLMLLALAAEMRFVPRAQAQNAIDTYTITGARIVTVSGPVIERGTVVIRDGLISAVGAGVSAPADARVIDGTGLTIYPGLIDANSSLGIAPSPPSPSPTQAARAAGAGTAPLPAQPQKAVSYQLSALKKSG
jgi:imidazolonepropionase-like amidohydrolase